MRELRPHVGSLEAFLERVEAQRRDGYRLVGSFEEGEDDAVAAAGFRPMENLVSGRFLYVDDLSTLPGFRRRGHAGSLLRWLEAEARRLGCGQVQLDSGLNRREAHRLYLAGGFQVVSYHFARGIGGDEGRS